jgi:predicted nucleic acid-binding protein
MSPDAVLLDTVGMLAIWDEDDQWHEPAEAAYREILARPVALLTTGFILLECANAAARKPYRPDVADLRDRLAARGGVHWPSDEELAEAWLTYRVGPPGGPGVVDLISFSTMRRLGVSRAFTNDKHFRAAGFVTLF